MKLTNFEMMSFQGSKYPASRPMYEETNRTVEKWTEIVAFVMAKATPLSWIAPKVIISYYLYFTSDMGDGAFELPLPIWYQI